MKVFFFKNEAHFHPRISYTFENAQTVNSNRRTQKYGKYMGWFFSILFLIFVFLFSENIISNYAFYCVFALIFLPLHELCHALFCWISGRLVERICFFPYKNIFSSIAAYVKPAFGVWNKTQSILFSLFPFIMLTVIPAITAVFVSEMRVELLYISLLNLGGSCFDIADFLYLLKTPRKSLHFGDFILTVEKSDQPVIIHRLSVTPELDKIAHKCYQYCENRLIEIAPAPESSEVIGLRREFVQQFRLEL